MKCTSPTSRAALVRAIAVLGGQTALASAAGKSQGHVSHWLKAGRVPADYCPDIEEATRERGAAVFCEELCPEVNWATVRKHKSHVGAEARPPTLNVSNVAGAV